MQSDPRISSALLALRPRISAFRRAVSGALERARATLVPESEPDQTSTTLGDFGGRLIDAGRFASISSRLTILDDAMRAPVKRAMEVLEELASSPDDLFIIDVPAGGSLGAALQTRLADLGRVFGAATLVDQVRRGMWDPAQDQSCLDAHPFASWSASERRFAPPLIVLIAGNDLDAFALAPLIDGWVRFILVVREPSSEAPLARLISPGSFIAQVDDVKVIDVVADFDGPAVIAVMNGKEARFIHDPRAGAAFWQRLQISRLPDIPARKPSGVHSAWERREDLAHLSALSERPVIVANASDQSAGAGVISGSDATESLTAWLLGQAGGNESFGVAS